jgi:hypothetical protein
VKCVVSVPSVAVFPGSTSEALDVARAGWIEARHRAGAFGRGELGERNPPIRGIAHILHPIEMRSAERLGIKMKRVRRLESRPAQIESREDVERLSDHDAACRTSTPMRS